MAKLIYENDAGHQVTFEMAEGFAKRLNTELGIKAWDEVIQVLKTEIIEQGETE